MNVIIKLSVLMVFIICSACGSNTPGLDELKRLCEKDAGLTIHKTVEAEGYYDATGSNTIVAETDYRFIEFCNDDPAFIDAIPEPGCWRVSKVKRESGQCYERLDKSLAKIVVDPYPEFLKDHCLAVEKIEQPEARYSYHSGLESWPAKNGVSEFIRSYAQLKETESGEILGEYISYSYNDRPRHTSPRHCDFIDNDKFPPYTDAKFINTVLTPVSKRSQP